jgi:hypothetical protein
MCGSKLQGGPVEEPTFPAESVPRAKRTVNSLQGVPSMRSFCVVSFKARGRRKRSERGKEAASGRRERRRMGNCIVAWLEETKKRKRK